MKVFVVVGIWRGVLDSTQVFQNIEDAKKAQAAKKKDYDHDADKWEDEPDENMDYDVSIQEVEVN